MIVTFIYKVKGNSQTYFGKYVGYISGSYENGLNNEIKKIIYPIIKTKHNIYSSDLCVGILYSLNGGFYDCVNEQDIFNLLIIEEINKIYLDHEDITIIEESTEEEYNSSEDEEEYNSSEDDEEYNSENNVQINEILEVD